MRIKLNTTHYFQTQVIDRHPEAFVYIAYVAQALVDPIAIENQPDGRTRRWVYVPEEDKYLRVVVLADGATIHDAFYDRNFKRRRERDA